MHLGTRDWLAGYAETGCSVGTVKSQASRGIATLRAILAADPGVLGEEP